MTHYQRLTRGAQPSRTVSGRANVEVYGLRFTYFLTTFSARCANTPFSTDSKTNQPLHLAIKPKIILIRPILFMFLPLLFACVISLFL